MPEPKYNTHHDSRLTALETGFGSLRDDIHSLATAVDNLRSVVANQRVPQWGVIFTALGVGFTVIYSIGSAAIAPINKNIVHHEKLITENIALSERLQERLREAESQIDSNRLIREAKFEMVQKQLDDIIMNDVPGSRERFARIETWMDIQDSRTEK